jgi:hypothetical protein
MAALARRSVARPVLLRALVAVASLTLAACGTNLSTMSPAETTPAGHVRVAGGGGLSAPVGTITTLLRQGERLATRAAEGEPLSEAERDELLRASIAALFALPSVNPELQARIGLHERVDVGLRLGAGALRADGRVMVVAPDAPGALAVSAGLGLGYYAFSVPTPSFVERVVRLSDYRRFELDVPLLFGWSTDIWRVWTGPKLVFTTYGIDATLAAPMANAVASARGVQTFLAAQIGGALGFRHGWVVLELTVAYGLGGADIEVLGSRVIEVSTNDLVIYPALGLLLEI